MKTTVELPDDLVIAAKKHAAELRQPLRVLIENGLRAELTRRSRAGDSGNPVKLRWHTVDGGLPADVDVRDRVAMIEQLHRDK